MFKKKNTIPFEIVKKFVVFIAILYLFDYSVGRILKYWYFKQDSGLLYRTTYALDSTKAEIVILGSSYANHHYTSAPFKERLHSTFYNAGRDGNYIFYHYSILQGILKRYTPQKIILDFNFEAFKKDEITYETISSLLPYYDNHPEIRSIIQLKGPFEKYKLISKTYPFNSLIYTIGIGNLEYNKTKRNKNYDEGYIPLFKTWNHTLTTDTFPRLYDLDSIKINIFRSFLLDCIKSKTQLYIVVSPSFTKYTYKDPSIQIACNIANELNIPFFNFLNDTEILRHSTFFADRTHLNNEGAQVFSNKVIDRILKTEKVKAFSFVKSQ